MSDVSEFFRAARIVRGTMEFKRVIVLARFRELRYVVWHQTIEPFVVRLLGAIP